MVGMHFAWLGALFFIVVVLAAFIVGVVLLATRSLGRPVQAGHEAPLDVLARRFAAGEISAEDYQKARDLLRGDAPSS